MVAQYAYTPWGELESAAQAFDSVSTLRWKGLPYDAETGFYAMRARYYDPKIRRFVSEDPIGLSGGINTYAFAAGDPINASDPSGLDPCTAEQLEQGWRDIQVGIPDGPDSRTECMSNGGLPPILVRGWAPRIDWAAAFRELLDLEAEGYSAAWNGGTPPPGGGTGYLLGLASQAIGVRAPVARAAASSEALGAFAETLTPTVTVAKNIPSRPFINSPLLIREIMSTTRPRADPMGVFGVWRWDVAGSYNGVSGTWELVVNAQTRQIYHFLFKGAR